MKFNGWTSKPPRKTAHESSFSGRYATGIETECGRRECGFMPTSASGQLNFQIMVIGNSKHRDTQAKLCRRYGCRCLNLSQRHLRSSINTLGTIMRPPLQDIEIPQRWLIFSAGQRLHRVSSIKRDDEDGVQGVGSTVCGSSGLRRVMKGAHVWPTSS